MDAQLNQQDQRINKLQPVSIQAQTIQPAEENYRSRAGSRNSMQGPRGPTDNMISGGGVLIEATPNRLKAQTNAANGGIGVSYSNVVLAGGLNPTEGGGQQSLY